MLDERGAAYQVGDPLPAGGIVGAEAFFGEAGGWSVALVLAEGSPGVDDLNEIAAECEADVFVLVTAVEYVYVDFGKPTARPLKEVTLDEIRKHIADKQFPAGSMLPKIEAAVQFLETAKNQDARAVITDLFNMPKALAGETGTTIRK